MLLISLLIAAAINLSVLKSNNELEAIIRFPEGTSILAVALYCEHSERISVHRVDGETSKRVHYRNLHNDTYEIQIVAEDAGEKRTTHTQTLFISGD